MEAIERVLWYGAGLATGIVATYVLGLAMAAGLSERPIMRAPEPEDPDVIRLRDFAEASTHHHQGA